MFIIYFIIALLSIIAFKRHKDSYFIVLIGAIVSGGFGFLPSPAPIKISDITLLVIISCFILRKNLLSVKNDKIGKMILGLLCYYAIITFFTIFLHRESFISSIMVLRLELYLLLYFILKKMNRQEVFNAFAVLRIGTIISGIFFYLQLVGVTGFLNYNASEEISMTDGFARLTNIPLLCIVMFFYSLLYEKGKLRIFYTIFFGGMIIVAQSRGLFLSSIISVLLFLLFKRQLKKSLKVLFSFSLIGLLAYPIISYRFSDSGSTTSVASDVKFAFHTIVDSNPNLYDNSVIYSSGTFTFRLLMAKERIEYLSQSPLYLLFGVGSLHGNSSSMNQFHFNIGTEIIKDGHIEMQQIDTNDISFITHLVKFGFVYFFIYIALIILIVKRLLCRNDCLSNVCWLLVLCKILQCLGSDTFSGIDNMFFVLLITAVDFNNYHKKNRNEIQL